MILNWNDKKYKVLMSIQRKNRTEKLQSANIKLIFILKYFINLMSVTVSLICFKLLVETHKFCVLVAMPSWCVPKACGETGQRVNPH